MFICKKFNLLNIMCNIYKTSSSKRIKELKIDSTLWTDPKRIINLLDFNPTKIRYLYRT